jgi:hypothetical protein
MNGLQFGDDQNVDFRGGSPVLEMESDGLADVSIEFVDGTALGEDVFADSTGAPCLAVVINLDFDKHVGILALRCG